MPLLYYKFQCIIQSQKTLLLILSPSTTTLYGSTENLNIYTEATAITTSPSTFVTEADLETKIQAMFASFDEKFDKQDARFYKQHEELLNLTSISLCL